MKRPPNRLLRRWIIATACTVSITIVSTLSASGQQQAGERLREEMSILDSLDGYIFEARQAESTRIRTAAYLAAAVKRLDKATIELAEASTAFDTARKSFVATLRIARLTQGGGLLESLFVRDENMESIRRQALTRRLAATQADELAAMLAAYDKAVAMEFVAGMERAQTWVLNRVSEDAIVRLEEETARRRALLKQIDEDMTMYRRHSAELTGAERDMVRTIESRLNSASGPVNFESMAGKLKSPLVDATLLVPFGDVIHPRFKTTTPHPGWTLGFDSKGPRNVRNIAFGRVVWTGRMRGFGTTVVVDHASGWYSVYGGLSTLAVKESSIVREGDILGEIEAAPGDSRVTMYFELRRDSTAVDPQTYISRDLVRVEAAR